MKTIGGIGEQILKQGNKGVYQLVNDVVDVDMLSDKHKISLFDESRYDETIDGNKKNRILAGSLDSGDSLCDDRLINSLEDDDSSSESSSSDEETK